MLGSLHSLLVAETTDKKNAWFQVKEINGETASYIEDIKLAWHQACEDFKENRPQAIALLCQYALINASIKSRADIPPDLLVALVEDQNEKWKGWDSRARLDVCPTDAKVE